MFERKGSKEKKDGNVKKTTKQKEKENKQTNQKRDKKISKTF